MPDYLKRNYLEGPALLLVKEISVINEIWETLKEAFGSAMLLLQNKLSEIEKYGPIWKRKNDEGIIPEISNLVNAMEELRNLVKRHKIEPGLYHSGNLGIIYNIMGKQRTVRFTTEHIDNK